MSQHDAPPEQIDDVHSCIEALSALIDAAGTDQAGALFHSIRARAHRSEAAVAPWIEAAQTLRSEGTLGPDAFIYLLILLTEGVAEERLDTDPTLLRLQSELGVIERFRDDDEVDEWYFDGGPANWRAALHAWGLEFDQQWAHLLRRLGEPEIAAAFVLQHDEVNERVEAGRRFFFGSVDAMEPPEPASRLARSVHNTKETTMAANTGTATGTLTISSPTFTDHGSIPTEYTCEGEDISPPLQWSGVPNGTKSLALIVDDPDAPDPKAPKMVYVHWVLYNIPPSAKGLPEGASPDTLPQGTREGLNDWKRTGYGGPCPPIGRHRYFFKLYALDTELSGLSQPTKPQVEQAMRGHIVGQAQVVGTYEKTK